MIRLALPLLFALATTAPLGAQGPGAGIDSIFAAYNRTDGPGCTVGVRRNGETLHAKGYGMANLEYGVPLTAASILESGSVAKQFTAAALVLLAQQGRLSLDDEVRTHVPELPDFGHRITLRHLLHHTSGMRDQWGLLSIAGRGPGQQVHTIPLILDLLSRQRMLNFVPGEEYLYSNSGYTLAAVVVSRVAKQPFARFSEEQLFRPLGMRNTRWRDDYRRVVPGRATAYELENGAWMQDMPFTMVHGNGGLLTTVEDLLIWNDALTAGTVPGGPDLVRHLEQTGTLNDGLPIRYALGLSIGSHRGLREVSHSGSTAGYRTHLARWPEQGLSVAVLCNAANAGATQLARRVADRVLGLAAAPPQPPSAAVPIGVADLEALAGTYRDSTTDQTVTFAVRDGALTVSGGGPAATLTHLGGRRFWSAAAGEFTFERAGGGWRAVQFAEGWRRYEPVTRVGPEDVRPDELAGTYWSPELDLTVQVTPSDSGIALVRRPGPPMRLTPTYRDGFAGGGMSFRFMRDAAGAVTGFRVFAGRVRDLRFERR